MLSMRFTFKYAIYICSRVFTIFSLQKAETVNKKAAKTHERDANDRVIHEQLS